MSLSGQQWTESKNSVIPTDICGILIIPEMMENAQNTSIIVILLTLYIVKLLYYDQRLQGSVTRVLKRKNMYTLPADLPPPFMKIKA